MARSEPNRYERRLRALKNERSSWEPDWKEVSSYVDPYGTRFPNEKVNDGARKDQRILNNTATLSLRNLRSGLMGGLTNPAQPWFSLNLTDANKTRPTQVKSWLEECTDVMRSVFAQSNTYGALHTAYGQLGAYGVAAVLVDESEDPAKPPIRLTPFPVGQFYLATNSEGRVDCCYREFEMTVRQLAQRFGFESLRDGTKRLYEQKSFDKWIKVIHVIEPRKERDPEGKTTKDMPFASVYFEKGAQSGEYLQESGYKEFPVLCPRWDAIGEDVYGRAPAMISIGDIKALQVMEMRKAEAEAKLVNPPMVLMGEIIGQRVGLSPGYVNRVPSSAGESGFKPVYEINPRLNELIADIQSVEERIKRAFFEDLFLMVAQLDNVRTATEILERKAEKLLMLGPVIQSLEQELLDPLIKRTFRILFERGMFGDAPMGIELTDNSLAVAYESPLAASQKAQSVGHIEAFMNLAGPIISASQEALMRVNFEELIKELAYKTGITVNAVRDDEEVETMKEQQAQAAAAQQQGEQAMQAVQSAKLLSEAQIQGDNALGAMLGQTGIR
jgi:hypothetical protein